MTSVGPGRSIHCTWRVSIAASSTSRRQRSDLGVDPHLSQDVAGARDELELVQGVVGLVEDVDAHRRGPLEAALVPPAVGVDDVADEAVTRDVERGELREVHVLEVGEDVADDPKRRSAHPGGRSGSRPP